MLNDNIADGRDVSWVWDADFELLAPRVRRVTCSRHARRRARAAPEVRGRAGSSASRSTPRSTRALDAAARDRADGGAPLFALPTYTAMLALRDLLAERGVVRSSWADASAAHDRERDRRSSGTTSSAAPTAPTSRCGSRSRPQRGAGPVLDVGAGTGRVALALARAGHEVIALDADPELLGELRAPRRRAARAHRAAATRATLAR